MPWLLVLIQFAALGFMAVSGPLLPANWLLLALELGGLALGAWAVFTMGAGNISILPVPMKDAQLVTGGPYATIHHPMYLALLLVTLPLVMNSFTQPRLIAWLILLVDLVIKLNYEENQLLEKIAEYRQYMQKTWRLVPYLY